MARYIDADALIENSDVFTLHTKEYGSIEVIPVDAVGDAPTIEARPVVRGEWVDLGRNYYTVVSQCSECGAKYDFRSPYCPNCGADMRPKEESEDAGN